MAMSVALVAVIMAIRYRRMSRTRPLKVGRLWIVPLLLTFAVAALFWSAPPHGLGWLYCALALGLGSVLGWYRGRMMVIEVDPQTHMLGQRASPAAMLFVVVLVLLRMGARLLAVELDLDAGTVALVTDILTAFALGVIGVQRVEMAVRARRLLDEARAQIR
ncbi:MAG: hypothetical protein ABW184_01390 [Sphingobium sp.]